MARTKKPSAKEALKVATDQLGLYQEYFFLTELGYEPQEFDVQTRDEAALHVKVLGADRMSGGVVIVEWGGGRSLFWLWGLIADWSHSHDVYLQGFARKLSSTFSNVEPRRSRGV